MTLSTSISTTLKTDWLMGDLLRAKNFTPPVQFPLRPVRVAIKSPHPVEQSQKAYSRSALRHVVIPSFHDSGFPHI